VTFLVFRPNFVVHSSRIHPDTPVKSNNLNQYATITRKRCEIMICYYPYWLSIDTKIGYLEWPRTAVLPSLRVISHKLAAFRANCVKFIEVSNKNVALEIYSFWQYTVYSRRHALSLQQLSSCLIWIFHSLTIISIRYCCGTERRVLTV